MSNSELRSLGKRLEDLIKREQSYLNPELSLEDLATAVGANRQKVSQTFNLIFEANFYDYINGKRVEKAKMLLKDPDYDGNILALSIDCGFKSRSVFYTAFKKQTGATPTEYKNSPNL